MKLPQPLIAGRLLRRYKRFFADVELADGRIVTAHTPNTGAMTQCAIPGHEVLLCANDNPRRKLKFTLELIRVNGSWVDTNTQRSNRVVEEALRADQIPELTGYEVTPEYPFGDSRLDFLLSGEQGKALVEVKNVTLCCHATIACFPDAVTVRGQKHLRELLMAVTGGYRAIIFFLVQRAEATAFSPADSIDPEYGRRLRQAVAGGVEVLAYRTLVSVTECRLEQRMPVQL
ncbi:MAG: DNA/RNA nuclease SfsA [Desulfuromonadaceae bacterium]|nr:DNA/RNA nuclease SfsA [Desulfuromonadaceae bacterium]